MSNGKQEQNNTEEALSYHATVAVIGFFGGVFWSALAYVAYVFSFTRVGPSMILLPWALPDWKNGWLGQLIGILAIGIISIGVAFIYRIVFVKINKMWPGAVFGFVLWAIVFGAFNPMFPGVDPLTRMDVNTLITTLCLYVLYGAFIGYSVAYEYDERLRAEGESIQS
ncbi:YqhR family membrane protein [Alteribacter lacisalsi]|uniref:YqhR family membrane protein n=1 Tax=Alteribacter lacisalsi TaxID=2045244 RepID=UPI001F202805|nr:YqhR family membrane protein [Alteribacter lacisalsi]